MSLYGHVAEQVKGVAARFGLTVQRRRPERDAVSQLVVKMGEAGVATLLDVGANTGQFAQAARKAGYRGTIYSFEPLPEAHAACAGAAAGDPRWHVPPPMALGSKRASAEINVSHNLASSSLLEVGERSVRAAPESDFKDRIPVEIHRLDDVADPAWQRPFALKIDTQGFEREVIGGAPKTLQATKLILVEMSLAPLYEGAPAFWELYRDLEEEGFRCIGLNQGFADLDRHELLQADGLFMRD